MPTAVRYVYFDIKINISTKFISDKYMKICAVELKNIV
jgi:hypothetical protein